MSLVTVQRNPDSSTADIDKTYDDEDKDLFGQLEIIDPAEDDVAAASVKGGARKPKSVSDIASVFSPGRQLKAAATAAALNQYPVSSSPALVARGKSTATSPKPPPPPPLLVTKAPAESPKPRTPPASTQSSILAIRNKLFQLNPTGATGDDVDQVVDGTAKSTPIVSVYRGNDNDETRSFSHSLLTASHNVSTQSSSRHLIEKYFVVKDAALILPRRSSSSNMSLSLSAANASSYLPSSHPTDLLICTTNSSISVANFQAADYDDVSKRLLDVSASQGDVGELPAASDALDSCEQIPASLRSTGEILIHLQAMISLIRPNDTISVAVKLSSYLQDRVRYLVIVQTKSSLNQSMDMDSESSCDESAILGLDLYPDSASGAQSLPACTVGLVLPIYANSQISLNGDGGFKFQSHQSTHIFKPVSIQAMWSAYQFLHRATENARKYNFYSTTSPVGSTDYQSLPELLEPAVSMATPASNYQNHAWVKYYTSLIVKSSGLASGTSTISSATSGTPPNPNSGANSFINEWYQKEERSAQREDFMTPYFDGLQLCGKEQEETGMRIKEKLKEIMMRSKDDYGTMSSVAIRELLEKELNANLDGFKKFIDVTIFQFYNQLIECASKILPYLYLGSEWNASNFDWLYEDKITHILNVSNDVDNFFPDTFKYLNIRVLDQEDTDLLKEFDRTNRFIQEAREQGTCCLVHCKMGVSRSASVVLAYLMKELNMSYEAAFNFAKQKRNCINPNEGFKKQLVTYEGILNAHKAKYQLFEQSSIPPSVPLTTLIEAEDVSQPPQTLEDDQTISVRETINKLKAISAVTSSESVAQMSTFISICPMSNRYSSANQPSPPSSSSSSSSSSSLNHSPASTVKTPNKPARGSATSLAKLQTKSPSPSNIKRTTSHLTTQHEKKKLLESTSPEPTREAEQQRSPQTFKKANSVSFSSRLLQQFSSASNGALGSSQTGAGGAGGPTSPTQVNHHYRSKSSSGNDNDYGPTADQTGSVASLNSVRRMAEVLNNLSHEKTATVVPPSSPPPTVQAPTTVSAVSPTQTIVDTGEAATGGQSSLYVPLGTVKRQVESINFKSRPCTPQVTDGDLSSNSETMALDCGVLNTQNGQGDELLTLKKRQSALSLNDMPFQDEAASASQISSVVAAGSSKVSFYLNDTTTSPLRAGGTSPNNAADASALSMTTTSPDSKRFKPESTAPTPQSPTDTAETTSPSTLYNRQSDFNRSKKVFEFLADKQRQQQQEEEQQQPTGVETSPVAKPLDNNNSSSNRSSFKSSQPAASVPAESVTSTATVTLRRRNELGKCHPLSVLINKTN